MQLDYFAKIAIFQACQLCTYSYNRIYVWRASRENMLEWKYVIGTAWHFPINSFSTLFRGIKSRNEIFPWSTLTKYGFQTESKVQLLRASEKLIFSPYFFTIKHITIT